MILNGVGNVIHSEWLILPNHFNNVALGDLVIMPNHFHGIIIIKNNHGREDLAPTLGNIVAYFKYQSTKKIHDTVGAGFSRPIPKIWQRNYYEHIIRDDPDLDRICEYIKTNPENWDSDKLHP